MSIDRIRTFAARTGAAFFGAAFLPRRAPGLLAGALLSALSAAPLLADVAKPDAVAPVPPYLLSAPEIVGGDPVSTTRWRRNFRFMVAMIYEPSGQQFCGAALIDASWVLTAAHCVEDLPTEDLSLLLNTPVLSSGGRLVEATQIVMHPRYDSESMENDVALIRLAQPQTTPRALVATTALTDDLAAPDDRVRALGWGALVEDGDGPDRLYEVALPVRSLAECRAAYPEYQIFASMICAGRDSGGIDTCQGDSGGPLVVRSPQGWVQVGITSWGIGCARPGRLGVYTRVAAYNDWIASVIADTVTCLDSANLPSVIALPADFQCTSLGRGDDAASGLVAIGFPVRLGDDTFTTVSVHNNGYVTLGSLFDGYNPVPLTSVSAPIIAPFFADVQTQAAQSGVVHYGQGRVDGHRAFSAIWPLVGYYENGTDRLNAFQVTLIELARNSGNFRIVFNFGQIQWEAGDSHGGSGGLGGRAARVGYSLVPGDTAFALEIAGSGRAGRLLDGGRRALVTRTNTGVPGRLSWIIRGGAPR